MRKKRGVTSSEPMLADETETLMRNRDLIVLLFFSTLL